MAHKRDEYFDKYNTFTWTNFDGKMEFGEELTELFLIDVNLDKILGAIRFKYIGEQIINGVKYLIVNDTNEPTSINIVLDSRRLFTSNIEAYSYMYRYDKTEPQAPTMNEINEIMAVGYPWW